MRSSDTSGPGSPPLNEFQLLMRGWAELAPYNFIHAIRLPASADMQRWRDAVHDAMPQLGIEPDRVEIAQPAELEAHFEAELQRPFDSYAVPVRFFVVNERDDSHWFGITLDHWFADDFSSRLLLQQIYGIYSAQANVASASCRWDIGQQPMPTQPRSRQRLNLGSRWRDWRKFVQQSAVMRGAYRVPFEDPLDFSVGTFRVMLPQSALDGLRKFSNHNGATIHDAFLAATAQAFGESLLGKAVSKRDLMAVVTIMNSRRFEDGNNHDHFGVRLSQYIVIERRPHDHSLNEVVRRIADQTRPVKASPRPDMVAQTRLMWRLNFTRRSKATFFVRGAPLVTGLSNVNLTGSWLEQPGIADFRRIGPTGPVIPMLLMITTFRGRIFFDVTYRKTAFKRPAAEKLVTEIVARLPA